MQHQNQLHRAVVAQRISHGLRARQDIEEMKDNLLLHFAALALEEKLKQRVSAEYLQKIGVLLHKIQSTQYELKYALTRRPSLVDEENKDYNDTLDKLLLGANKLENKIALRGAIKDLEKAGLIQRIVLKISMLP